MLRYRNCNRRLLPPMLSLLLAMLCIPQSGLAQRRFRIVSWNVENLFDAAHDSLKHDEEFLPDAEREWTWGRYWRKIADIGRVVMGIGEDAPPALVALCEVENDSVMTCLSKRGTLRAIGYHYVMTDSPDRRGVDVGLMYQPLMFRLLGSESHRIPSEAHGLPPTRDLLHAWGRTTSGDTLHVVVCHLPSRLGGRTGKRNRQLAALTLRQLTDSLLHAHPRCRLVVMGDFNAPPHDAIFKKQLNGWDMSPMIPQKRRPTQGTYRYKGNWSWIDHIFVSPALLPAAKGLAKLYTQPWMQRRMADGTWYPRRTYLGTHYQGGVSDHVPLYLDLELGTNP